MGRMKPAAASWYTTVGAVEKWSQNRSKRMTVTVVGARVPQLTKLAEVS